MQSNEVIARFCQLLPDLYLGLKPEQPVFIHASRSHEPFFRLAMEALERSGPREILAHLVDPALHSVEEICARQAVLAEKSLRLGAAYLKITGPEGPDFYTGLTSEERQQLDTVGLKPCGEYRRRLMAGLVQRCLLPGPTAAWGALVYPELTIEEAETRLATDLASFCFLDQEDPEQAFLAFDEILDQEREKLQNLGIRSVLIEKMVPLLLICLSFDNP
jgi:hypothetical protein